MNIRSALWLGLIVLCVPAPSWALLVRSVNLEELVDRADRIILGRVVSIQDEKTTNGLPAVATTFEVYETWKGKSKSTVVVRQLGVVNPTHPGILGDLPRFHVGETAVVFLPPPSRIGLASPVGIDQGVFRLLSKQGRVQDQTPLLHSKNQLLFRGLKGTRLSSRVHSLKLEETPSLRLGSLRELVKIHRGSKP